MLKPEGVPYVRFDVAKNGCAQSDGGDGIQVGVVLTLLGGEEVGDGVSEGWGTGGAADKEHVSDGGHFDLAFQEEVGDANAEVLGEVEADVVVGFASKGDDLGKERTLQSAGVIRGGENRENAKAKQRLTLIPTSERALSCTLAFSQTDKSSDFWAGERPSKSTPVTESTWPSTLKVRSTPPWWGRPLTARTLMMMPPSSSSRTRSKQTSKVPPPAVGGKAVSTGVLDVLVRKNHVPRSHTSTHRGSPDFFTCSWTPAASAAAMGSLMKPPKLFL